MKMTDPTGVMAGLDVHRRFSTVTARNAEGKITWRQRLEHQDRDGLRECLTERARRMREREIQPKAGAQKKVTRRSCWTGRRIFLKEESFKSPILRMQGESLSRIAVGIRLALRFESDQPRFDELAAGLFRIVRAVQGR